MGKERAFFTGSTNIIGDPRPSGLDMRVYACVSLHDGMSLHNGKGRGCYATFATLTARLGCDAANLSRSLKRLVDWGYLTEERQDDRRRKSYRVTFDSAEGWQNRQRSLLVKLPTTEAEPAAEIVGNDDARNGRNPPQTEQHYSSLKGLDPSERGELDPVETELNSEESARFAARDDFQFDSHLSDDANLARLERALKSGSPIRVVACYACLYALIDRADDAQVVSHIHRLKEALADRMTQGEIDDARQLFERVRAQAQGADADTTVIPFPAAARRRHGDASETDAG